MPSVTKKERKLFDRRLDEIGVERSMTLEIMSSIALLQAKETKGTILIQRMPNYGFMMAVIPPKKKK